MRQLLEFLPIALFFIVYQLDGETIELGGWGEIPVTASWVVLLRRANMPLFNSIG